MGVMAHHPTHDRLAQRMAVAVGAQAGGLHGAQLPDHLLVVAAMLEVGRVIGLLHQLFLTVEAAAHIFHDCVDPRALAVVARAMAPPAFHQRIEDAGHQETQTFGVGVDLAHAG